MKRASNMKPETMLKMIENAKAVVKVAEERVQKRKERLARAKKCVKKCQEDRDSYEERLEGVRETLKRYEARAALMNEDWLEQQNEERNKNG